MDYFRSLLFVPGNQPKMLEKAATFYPDVFIPDMEDSVAENDKDDAREIVSEHIELLSSEGVPVIPRLNSLDSGFFEKDLNAVISKGVYGISVGKINSTRDIDKVEEILKTAERNAGIEVGTLNLIPWIETANAIIGCHSILTHSNRICASAFGAEDFTNDMGIERRGDDKDISFAKNYMSIASRAAGVPALDTPFFGFKDPDALRSNSILSKSIGYKGKFAIHPAQIDVINESFTPGANEIEHARRVIEVFEQSASQGRGSTSLDGLVIDVPVVKRAQALIETAERFKKDD